MHVSSLPLWAYSQHNFLSVRSIQNIEKDPTANMVKTGKCETCLIGQKVFKYEEYILEGLTALF